MTRLELEAARAAGVTPTELLRLSNVERSLLTAAYLMRNQS